MIDSACLWLQDVSSIQLKHIVGVLLHSRHSCRGALQFVGLAAVGNWEVVRNTFLGSGSRVSMCWDTLNNPPCKRHATATCNCDSEVRWGYTGLTTHAW